MINTVEVLTFLNVVKPPPLLHRRQVYRTYLVLSLILTKPLFNQHLLTSRELRERRMQDDSPYAKLAQYNRKVYERPVTVKKGRLVTKG